EPREVAQAERAVERLAAHVPKRGHVRRRVYEHHPADLSRTGETQPPAALEKKLDPRVLGTFGVAAVEIKLAAHSEMKDQRPPVVQGYDQILPAALGTDKCAPDESGGEDSRAGPSDDVWRGDRDSMHALAQRHSLEKLELVFYFGKLG